MKLRNFAFSVVILAGSNLSASVITYETTLTGPNESPANASPGIGFALVTVDTLLNTMEVNVTFSGLTTADTASHIHCCIAAPGTAGVATTTPTFTGFPGGVTSGSYDHVFDMTLVSSYNPTFVTANGGTTSSAETALLGGIAAGQAYLNIHTGQFPTGEIRGFLVATPEPASLGLVGAALVGLLFLGRRCGIAA